MKKTRWLKTIGIISTSSLVIIPTTISTISCTNEDKLPDQPLKVDTSHIENFADAINFTNKYLQKNYNFAMFKNDVNKFVNYHKQLIQEQGVNLTCTISYTKENKNSLNINSLWIVESKDLTQTIKGEWTNVKVLPMLIKEENKIKVKLLTTFNPKIWPSYFESENNPNVFQENWIYDKLENLKQENQDYNNKTFLEYSIQTTGESPTDESPTNLQGFIINKSDLNLLKSKIFAKESIWDLFGNNTISTILDMEYCPITFDNINDINENLYTEYF